MKPLYIQFNCVEADKIDPRQANAVKKYKPDIIIFEFPNRNKTPNTIYNKFTPSKKPLKEVRKFQKYLLSKKVGKIAPWARSDVEVFNNIVKLWEQGNEILLYKIDAPPELIEEKMYKIERKYPATRNNWLFWLKLYLRECYMTNNLNWVLKNYKAKNNPKILIFLQSIHWKHVKFLMSNPTKKKIWDYYFKRFPELNQKNISNKIKAESKILNKYWEKISHFIV